MFFARGLRIGICQSQERCFDGILHNVPSPQYFYDIRKSERALLSLNHGMSWKIDPVFFISKAWDLKQVSQPQFPSSQNENNNTYFAGLLGLSQLTHVKHAVQNVARGKHSLSGLIVPGTRTLVQDSLGESPSQTQKLFFQLYYGNFYTRKE